MPGRLSLLSRISRDSTNRLLVLPDIPALSRPLIVNNSHAPHRRSVRMATEPFTPSRVDETNAMLESSGPENVLEWGIRTFGDRIALCSAFGPEGMVLLHILSEMKQHIRVFTLDTGRLHPETHDLMQKVQDLYGFEIDVYCPDPSDVRAMVKEYGINLFYEGVERRELCCEVRKVRPMLRALEGLSAWITGLRRIQTITRRAARKVELDELHGNIVKINPLAY